MGLIQTLAGLYSFEFLVGQRHYFVVTEITAGGIMPNELDRVTKLWSTNFLFKTADSPQPVKLIDWRRLDQMPAGILLTPVGSDPILIWKSEGR